MPIRRFREFIKLESSAGVILFCTAVLALIIDNTPLHVYYHAFFQLPVSIQLGVLHLKKPLLLWINDGFMAIFFLLVGLEIKREIVEGELSTFSKSVLPAVAAIGGMVVPAIFYIACNYHDSYALRGWAIPAATDIAFSLGILALLGSRIPLSLKVFLTALAIIDDIGAIVVIAVFYSANISFIMLFIAACLIILLILMNYFRVVHISAYIIVGVALWICVLKSGVHATLAGIVVALAIPMFNNKKPSYSPLKSLEHTLHPWVAFGILPIFAFANAGVSFHGLHLDQLFSSVPMGIAGGLFIGKQLGIWGFTMLMVKLGWVKLPRGVSSLGIYGIALVAGVGFTMSLFIGSLAFGEANAQFAAYVRFGVLVGSIVSGILGYIVLHLVHPKIEQGIS